MANLILIYYFEAISFSLFYQLTWVHRCWPRATPDFGSLSVITSFLLQDIPRHPDTRLFGRHLHALSCLVFEHIFAHVSHFFASGGPPGVLPGFLRGAGALVARNTPARVLRRAQQTPDHINALCCAVL